MKNTKAVKCPIDWSEVPERYEWVSLDVEGDIYGHVHKPVLMDMLGWWHSGDCILIRKGAEGLEFIDLSECGIWHRGDPQELVNKKDPLYILNLIETFYEENFVDKFSTQDTEYVKELIRDFVTNYYNE